MKHDLFKIKQVAQAVSLVAALLSAPAVYAQNFISWGTHDETEFSQVVVPMSGSFADYISFTIENPIGLTNVAVSNNLPGSFLISNGRVELFKKVGALVSDGISFNGSYNYDFDGTTGSTSHVFSNLVSGNYFYKVTGIAGSQTGGTADMGLYSITSSLNPVTPVPEPEIYAMMAAGLGLMGFIGRRRSRRDK
jgi:hypothetical protein